MINQSIFLLVITVLLAISPVACLVKTSALRMCDSYDCELQLYLTSKAYTLYIPVAHLKSNPYFVFCFRIRNPKSSDSQSCTLQGLNNTYKCIDVTSTTSTAGNFSIAMQSWAADATLLGNKTSAQDYTAATYSTITTTQVLINLQSLLITSYIYEIYVGYVANLLADSRTKNAFFMTYQFANQETSDNLFMQRNVFCNLFYKNQYLNYNFLFYGGVVRGGNDTLFLHALTYLIDSSETVYPTNESLNVWIGISFGTFAHASRDMIAFVSDTFQTLDLFSLYYAAPYLDTSQNIKGTNDLIDIGDSNAYAKGNTTYFYWTGASRKYVTGDLLGDEAIIKKMNATITYAIGYNPLTGPYSPLLAANQHDYYSSTYFNSAVWQPLLVLPLLALILSFLLA